MWLVGTNMWWDISDKDSRASKWAGNDDGSVK